MTHRRIPWRSAALTGIAAAALLAGSPAVAQPDAPARASAPASVRAAASGPEELTAAAAGRLAQVLRERLGDAAAGAYYEAGTETLVVNVVDPAAAAVVEAAGARSRRAGNSAAELEAARAALDALAEPGTAWAADPVTNSVRVTADATVTGTRLARVREAVAGLGGLAVLERAEGAFAPFLVGGEAVRSSDAHCSLGFNVTAKGRPGFLTAGHCGDTGSSWSAGGEQAGTMTESAFPGADYALVEYTADIAHPSEASLQDGTTRTLTGAGRATVGQHVQRSGSTTGLHEGTVTALDVSVSYPQGTVHGLIETSVCAEPGDSGGPLFAGTTALGLTSGGSGDCTAGGTTFFYPVTDALDAVDATLP